MFRMLFTLERSRRLSIRFTYNVTPNYLSFQPVFQVFIVLNPTLYELYNGLRRAIRKREKIDDGVHRDLQHHRAKSLASTLLGAGQFSCRRSEAGTPFINLKLHKSGQYSGKGRELKPLSEPIARLEHPHYPLTSGRLLVQFASV
jgi:hypothetical protein